MIDHTSAIRLYSTLSPPSTCAARTKYASVTRPVVAIPTARIRAPRPYPERGAPAPTEAATALQPDEQHRPRKRRARVHDVSVLRQQLDEAALRPVVQVARRVAELLEVCPARHVQ